MKERYFECHVCKGNVIRDFYEAANNSSRHNDTHFFWICEFCG